MAKETKLPDQDDTKQQPHELIYPQELQNTQTHTISNIYKFHLENHPEEKQSISVSPKPKQDLETLYQLIFEIKHCIYRAGSETFLLFSIYDGKSQSFLTEEYCLHLSQNNFPTKGTPDDCKILFKNLTQKHLQSDLFVVAKIYRYGQFNQPDVIKQSRTSSNKNKSTNKNNNTNITARKNKHDEMKVLRPYGVVVIRLKNCVLPLKNDIGKEIGFEPGTAPIYCPKQQNLFVTLHNDVIERNYTTSYFAPMSIGISHSFTLYQGNVDSVKQEYKEFDKVKQKYQQTDAYDTTIFVLNLMILLCFSFFVNVFGNFMFLYQLTSIEKLEIDPIVDDSMRHILYITIMETHISRRRNRGHLNTMCRIQLRDNKTFKPLPACITMGRGIMAIPKKTCETAAFDHTGDPLINQTYCISIPQNVEKLESCHLYFTMYHQPAHRVPADLRGFAFLKLYQDHLKQLSTNKIYELPIYQELPKRKDPSVTRIDKNDDDDQIDYLNDTKQLKSENKCIRIKFTLQSTKIFADSDIHCFLTWKKQNNLQDILAAMFRVVKKSMDQLVGILDVLMNTIFDIINESNDKVLIDRAFGALATILGNVNKGTCKKYIHRIETWIEKDFNYPGVWRVISYQLLITLQWIASDTAQEQLSRDSDAFWRSLGARNLRQSVQCARGIKHIFALMKRSCLLELECKTTQTQSEKEKTIHDYNSQVIQLLTAINKMMGVSMVQLSGVHCYTIRNFMFLLDSVINLTNDYSDDDDSVNTYTDRRRRSGGSNGSKLITIVSKFLDSTQNISISNNVEKLLLIGRFLEYPTLTRKDIVELFLPKCLKVLHFHVYGNIDEKLACFTIFQKCVNMIIIGDIDQDDSKVNVNRLQVLISEKMMNQLTSLMFQFFGAFEQTRKIDLSRDVINIQRIFGYPFKKNEDQASAVGEQQLSVHRDFCVTLADLARYVMLRDHNDGTYDNDGESVNSNASTFKSWGESGNRVNEVVQQLQDDYDEEETVSIIENVLQCCNSLLTHSVFPSTWIQMRMIEIELAMRGLSWFECVLNKCYSDAKYFEKRIWKEWFRLGMTFLAKEEFQLEDITMIHKERADLISNNFGDVRLLAIEKVKHVWEDLLTDTFRWELADVMIGAAIAASTSSTQDIQEFGINVYCEMIKLEYDMTNSIKTVEMYTIDEIDDLTTKFVQKPDLIQRCINFFKMDIRKKLHDTTNTTNSKLSTICDDFLIEIETLLNYLLNIQQYPLESMSEYEDERANEILKLLDYLQLPSTTKKIEYATVFYNRYIHRLGLMHRQLNNHVEAANCFKHHGDRLSWNETKILKAEKEEAKQTKVYVEKRERKIVLEQASECQRRIFLYNLSARNYMLGQAWELAIGVYKQLGDVYETKLYDFKSLSEVLEKQSRLWKMIGGQDRVFNSCYLVSFRGNFSNELKNKQFIYKSGNGIYPEPVRDFTYRIKSKWPQAIIRNTADPIPDEYQDEDGKYNGQYISITTLSPSSQDELKGGEFKWNNVENNRKVPLRIKKYYRENETNVYFYTYAKKISKSIKKETNYNEFRNLWITKVYIIGDDIIPSMRRRISVKNVIKIEYTPFQTAINNLIDKNNSIQQIIDKIDDKHENSLQFQYNIPMQLNGILDAAVMGGVSKYQEAFFDGQYLSQYPNEKRLVPQFLDALRNQLYIAEMGLMVYDKYCSENLRPHVEHLHGCMTKLQKQYRDFLTSISDLL